MLSLKYARYNFNKKKLKYTELKKEQTIEK